MRFDYDFINGASYGGGGSVSKLKANAKSGIRDLAKRQSGVMVFVGFITMLGFGFIPIFIEMNIRTDDNAHYSFWIFAVIGFFFFKYGRGKIRDYNEIGTTLLFLDGHCGRIGGTIVGRSKIKAIPTTKTITLRLLCKEFYKTKVNDRVQFNEAIRFQEGIDPEINSDLEGCSEIRFRIDIPRELPPSLNGKSRGTIHWYVELEGEFTALSGRTVDVKRIWKVPVTL
ncbi:hypothetical protein ACMXYN_09700 [Neptuniibacter sp. PT8_73]|uniref:hypothetical protein n=1 Tax=Neptuniibacter sp. PT8_73 TaxID=3398206 RepID=UPI0039F643A0